MYVMYYDRLYIDKVIGNFQKVDIIIINNNNNNNKSKNKKNNVGSAWDPFRV